MRKAPLTGCGLLLTVVLTLTAFWWWQRPTTGAVATDPLLGMLADENNAGYSVATAPGAMRFPRDLGPHYDYQTEWWYYTGNLKTSSGRRFGYQLTFFRRALAPPGEAQDGGDAASWRTNQVYMAHFALSDIADGVFHKAEKFSREALGLAGARALPYDVWLGDWRARETKEGLVELVAQTEKVSLDLRVRQTLPPVLHGDLGLSVKNRETGNASYYYSLVQQETVGTVSVGGHRFSVSGVSWKDHEYMTNAMASEDVGWDWFGLQFDNGTALMLYQIRRADGRVSPFSGGSFVASDGKVTHLELSDWKMSAGDHWISEHSGASYPTTWEIDIEKLGFRLTATALIPNSEWRNATTYWEGAVDIDGSYLNMPLSGSGYVEMTGYSGAGP
ncbi:lipocalin-like domain-containing protein [Mycobacterium spongiae]|uniref:AttH domain-containing protein n=1 Tax=Mycobacterium spongiae TaxID=886343 RepID=A0A975K141_9MYCO|nr:lipocalin-like domain-containing protein [Mycobacterium spongiae]QUR68749.1 hypothetical protein F6B93_18215 [Mycobacterium spongiae]